MIRFKRLGETMNTHAKNREKKENNNINRQQKQLQQKQL